MRQTPLLQALPVRALRVGRFQPRQHFSETELSELADSISAQGLIQPIAVRKVGSDAYEIIAGERRWRAVQSLNWEHVNCLIYDMSDEDTAAVSLIENLLRADLNPIEVAQGYQRLLEEFSYTHDVVANLCGVSRSKVTNSLRLLQLIPTVQKAIADAQLSEGHAKLLASLNALQQKNFMRLTIRHQWSVRQLEEQLQYLKTPIEKKRFVKNHRDQAKDLDVIRLQKRLSDELHSEVLIEQTGLEGGWLKIRFYNNDTLAGILDRLSLDYE